VNVCQSCGASFDAEISFCGSCGAKLGLVKDFDAEPVDGPDPLVGTIIDGRYRVLLKLGEGGMGAVYKVEHVHMGKYMAMKLLLREFSGNRDLVRRFRREAQAVSSLSHVNTVQVFDFGRSSDGAMYMVMEFIQGENLAAVLHREGPMKPRRATKIIGQVCASLSEAHALGIVHRDLKPENVMLLRTKDERDFVKVLDFGLAKLRELDEGVTSHGSLVGTPYYMSPEQIKGADVDHRSDIYSLGAMMYKMLSGDPPFRAPSPIGVLTKHLQEAPRSFHEACPDLHVPTSTEAVIFRAMAKDREKRPQTVDELRRDLEAALTAPPSQSSVSTPRPKELLNFEDGPSEWSWASELNIGNRRDFDRFEQRMRRRRFLRWAMLFLVLGGAGGVLAYGYFQGNWFERLTESEPNNSRREANNISEGKRIKGFIGKRLSDERGDVDFYRLKPTGPGRRILRVEVSGVPNIDLQLEAYEGTQSKRPSFVANNTGVGGKEVIPNLRFESPVYIAVREVPQKGKIPTENISDPYYLVATTRPAAENEELEPNDELFTANDARLGVTISGFASKLGDRDYYRFPRSGDQGEVFRIETSAVPGVTLQVEAIAGGFRLQEKLPGTVTLPAGDKSLFVVVRAEKGFNYEKPYTLRVDKVK
jgi:serine/threonine-protein kinase